MSSEKKSSDPFAMAVHGSELDLLTDLKGTILLLTATKLIQIKAILYAGIFAETCYIVELYTYEKGYCLNCVPPIGWYNCSFFSFI